MSNAVALITNTSNTLKHFMDITMVPDKFIDTAAEVQAYMERSLNISKKSFDWDHLQVRLRERRDTKLTLSGVQTTIIQKEVSSISDFEPQIIKYLTDSLHITLQPTAVKQIFATISSTFDNLKKETEHCGIFGTDTNKKGGND
ncbi:hypothetical protein BGZ65_004251, partial [Modicella reniformis]